MTGAPPSFSGALHEKVTWVFDVEISFLTNVVGGLGAVNAIGMTAPLPSSETIDSPISLMAVTLAKTVASFDRSNGLYLKVSSTLTVQVLVEIMVALFSASQSDVSFSNVLLAVLISSLYPEMLKPPRSEGSSQDI